MGVHILTLLGGVAIIAAAVGLWRSESFYSYLWDARSRSVTRRIGPRDPRRARIGVKGALVGAIAIGLVLTVVGVSMLIGDL